MKLLNRITNILQKLEVVLILSYRKQGRIQHNTQHIKHNTASFICGPTDPTEIINIVKSANSSKSSGVDNIDPYVVQKIIPQIANQLAHIFNKSLQTGIVPDKLKISKVIPLYKNDNPELFKNYRPISILP